MQKIASFSLPKGGTQVPLYKEYERGKYHCTDDLLFDWFRISCMITDNFCFYLQSRLILTSQIGGQQYSDTSPFSIPCHIIQFSKNLFSGSSSLKGSFVYFYKEHWQKRKAQYRGQYYKTFYDVSCELSQQARAFVTFQPSLIFAGQTLQLITKICNLRP